MLEWKWKFDSKPALALCLCLSTKLGAVINMQQVLKHQTVTHVLTAHWLCQRNPMAAALSCEQAGAVSEPQIWNIGTDSFIVIWLGILVFVTPVIPQIVSLLLSKNLLWILQSCLTGSGCGDREGHSDVVYIIFTLIRPFSDSHEDRNISSGDKGNDSTQFCIDLQWPCPITGLANINYTSSKMTQEQIHLLTVEVQIWSVLSVYATHVLVRLSGT